MACGVPFPSLRCVVLYRALIWGFPSSPKTVWASRVENRMPQLLADSRSWVKIKTIYSLSTSYEIFDETSLLFSTENGSFLYQN